MISRLPILLSYPSPREIKGKYWVLASKDSIGFFGGEYSHEHAWLNPYRGTAGYRKSAEDAIF